MLPEAAWTVQGLVQEKHCNRIPMGQERKEGGRGVGGGVVRVVVIQERGDKKE